MSPKRILSTKYGTLLSNNESVDFYRIVFYRSASGREPVREWLKQLRPAYRKQVGEDLYTLQLGWPVGMPLARKLEPDLWELRSHIPNGIVRVLFTQDKRVLVLLHAFIKKSRKLPPGELAVAKERLTTLRTGRKL